MKMPSFGRWNLPGVLRSERKGAKRVDPQTSPSNRAALGKAILSDTHFWVPAIVLLAGLLILHWIR